jgi:hypothetical protein
MRLASSDSRTAATGGSAATRIGHHEHMACAQLGELEAHFAGDAGAEAHGRHGHLEGVVVIHR